MSNRPKPTYANVVASLALFVALGGSAYAAGTIGSEEVIDNSLRTVDLRDGDVRSTDIRDDTLAGGGLVAADVADGALSGAEIATDSLTSEDINERTIAQSTFDQAGDTVCDPSSVTMVTCASVDFTGAPAGNLDAFLVGALSWKTDGGGGQGVCELRVRGAGAPLTTRVFGETSNTTNATHLHSGTLMHVADLGAGSTTKIVDLRCNQGEDDIVYTNLDLAVIGLEY